MGNSNLTALQNTMSTIHTDTQTELDRLDGLVPDLNDSYTSQLALTNQEYEEHYNCRTEYLNAINATDRTDTEACDALPGASSITLTADFPSINCPDISTCDPLVGNAKTDMANLKYAQEDMDAAFKLYQALKSHCSLASCASQKEDRNDAMCKTGTLHSSTCGNLTGWKNYWETAKADQLERESDYREIDAIICLADQYHQGIELTADVINTCNTRDSGNYPHQLDGKGVGDFSLDYCSQSTVTFYNGKVIVDTPAPWAEEAKEWVFADLCDIPDDSP